MNSIAVPSQRLQLVSVNGLTDLWQDLSPWYSTAGISDIRGVLILAEKFGSFRVHVGIQTATPDIEAPDSPVNPTTGTGLGYFSSVSKNQFIFDPTVAANGNITGKGPYFRLGVLYSSTDATVGRGDVIFRAVVSGK